VLLNELHILAATSTGPSQKSKIGHTAQRVVVLHRLIAVSPFEHRCPEAHSCV